MPGEQEKVESDRLTLWQRAGLRMVRRRAGRSADEPLKPEDWEVLWKLHETGAGGVFAALLRVLPSGPRCGVCAAPFGGPGRHLAGPLGYRPSRKNPTVCSVCVEAAPPGGMTMRAGIMFADLRGFTSRVEGETPEQASIVLRRFYRCAEEVLFPEAVIDKLIGDEVMALYLPMFKKGMTDLDVPPLMLRQAQELLRAVGYGSAAGPFVELGIGLDYGEAFVGNIGHRAVFDFTAVGDVVNTASRLQAEAAGGEILLSDRVATGLGAEPGQPEELTLKGKEEAQRAYRVAV